MEDAPRPATAQSSITAGRQTMPPLPHEMCTQARKRLTFVKSRFPLLRTHRQRSCFSASVAALLLWVLS
jgi:hypothetical protein